MLKLTEKDLGKPVLGGLPGIHVWWIKRPGGKRALMCVAWPGLVLINPRLQWPQDLWEKRIDGWGDEHRTFRISMVKGWIPAPVIRADVPVPDLAPVLEIAQGDSVLLTNTRSTVEVGQDNKLARLAAPDQSVYLVVMKSLRRISASLDTHYLRLKLRLLDPPWAPGKPVVLCYKGLVLRAIASTTTQEALP